MKLTSDLLLLPESASANLSPSLPLRPSHSLHTPDLCEPPLSPTSDPTQIKVLSISNPTAGRVTSVPWPLKPLGPAFLKVDTHQGCAVRFVAGEALTLSDSDFQIYTPIGVEPVLALGNDATCRHFKMLGYGLPLMSARCVFQSSVLVSFVFSIALG